MKARRNMSKIVTKNAAIITAMGLGAYAGVQGLVQAVVELCRGDAVNGFLIHAVGAPCTPDGVWHACMPAVTLLPTMMITGIAAGLVGLATVAWALFFVHRRRGGLVLIGLSVLLLLAGGGFTGPFVGLLGGLSALLAGRKAASDGGRSFPAGWWPWPLVILLTTYPFGFLLGYLFPALALDLRVLIIGVFDGLLPILTVWTGLAKGRMISGYRL